jgi:hypothetical protein
MSDHNAEIELVASWEGPAEHAPGVLFGESAGDEALSGGVSVADLAAWVALAAASGVIGNATFAAVRSKVLGVLSAWRHRKGQAALDALQQRVFDELNRHRAVGKLTEEELRTRVAALFADVRG